MGESGEPGLLWSAACFEVMFFMSSTRASCSRLSSSVCRLYLLTMYSGRSKANSASSSGGGDFVEVSLVKRKIWSILSSMVLLSFSIL
jgi:hypothetical protein